MLKFRKTLMAAAALAVVATPAAAHRMWLISSSTTVSGTNSWITVDAAVSNDLFHFDHQPLRVVPTVLQPDGTEGKVENYQVGRLRATFDVNLTQQGTYRIGFLNEGVSGSYKLNGEIKMLPRGTTKATLAAAVPQGATELRTAENLARNEIYVTQGNPTTTVFKPIGRGIELVPITHPTDLVAGETATFQFLLDGKPAQGLSVTAILGGRRYRDTLEEITPKTDAQGKVKITWPESGMYWLTVAPERERQAGAGGPAAAAMTTPRVDAPPARRVSYTTSLEVLSP